MSRTTESSPQARPRTAPSVAINVVANMVGRGWTGIISLIFVPLYIRFLGIEGYGLIGVYIALMALLAILDLGLCSTFTREAARLSAIPGTDQEVRDLARTLEIVYWGVGLALCLAVMAAAPYLARHWLHARGASPDLVRNAIVAMGVVVAFEWPAAIYAGGLLGLQRQLLYNGIRAGVATLQAGGAVLVLWLVSPTVTAYFLWQATASALQVVLLAAALRRALPAAPERPSFRKTLLRKNWRYAAGMTGIALLATVLTQLDKVVLTRLLSLEDFGYYILAYNVASALNNIVHPIFAGVFPRLSQLVAQNDGSELRLLYHRGCQLLSALVLPVAATLIFFSRETLLLWVGNPVTADRTCLLLSLFLVGTTLNAIMVPPYMLQLAHGWTSLSICTNAAAIAVFVPLLLFLATHYGAVGGAICWIALNAGYVLIQIPVMHRRLIPDEMWAWYLRDIAPPALAATSIALLSRHLLPTNFHGSFLLSWLVGTSAISFIAMIFSMKYVKDWMKRLLLQRMTS